MRVHPRYDRAAANCGKEKGKERKPLAFSPLLPEIDRVRPLSTNLPGERYGFEVIGGIRIDPRTITESHWPNALHGSHLAGVMYATAHAAIRAIVPDECEVTLTEIAYEFLKAVDVAMIERHLADGVSGLHFVAEVEAENERTTADLSVKIRVMGITGLVGFGQAQAKVDTHTDTFGVYPQFDSLNHQIATAFGTPVLQPVMRNYRLGLGCMGDVMYTNAAALFGAAEFCAAHGIRTVYGEYAPEPADEHYVLRNLVAKVPHFPNPYPGVACWSATVMSRGFRDTVIAIEMTQGSGTILTADAFLSSSYKSR